MKLKYVRTTQSYRPQVQTLKAVEAQFTILNKVEMPAKQIKDKSIEELTADLKRLVNMSPIEWAYEYEDYAVRLPVEQKQAEEWGV